MFGPRVSDARMGLCNKNRRKEKNDCNAVCLRVNVTSVRRGEKSEPGLKTGKKKKEEENTQQSLHSIPLKEPAANSA